MQLSTPNSPNGFAHILLLGLLVLGLVGGVVLVQQTNIFKSRAGGEAITVKYGGAILPKEGDKYISSSQKVTVEIKSPFVQTGNTVVVSTPAPVVTTYKLADLQASYGRRKGMDRYNPVYDLNSDNRVNITDFSLYKAKGLEGKPIPSSQVILTTAPVQATTAPTIVANTAFYKIAIGTNQTILDTAEVKTYGHPTTLVDFDLGTTGSKFIFVEFLDAQKKPQGEVRKQQVEYRVATGGNTGTGSSLTNGLLAFYKMNEVEGKEVRSSVGDYHASSNSTTNIVPCKLTHCRSFNSSNYISTQLSVALNNLIGISVSSWVKTNFTGANQYVFAKDDGATVHTRINLLNKKVNFWANNRNCETSKKVADNNWHFIVGTYDGSKAKVYLDNQLAATCDITGKLPAKDIQTLIGTRAALDDKFTGLIDAVGVWGRALTADEVGKLWNSGAGLELPESTNTTTPTPTRDPIPIGGYSTPSSYSYPTPSNVGVGVTSPTYIYPTPQSYTTPSYTSPGYGSPYATPPSP